MVDIKHPDAVYELRLFLIESQAVCESTIDLHKCLAIKRRQAITK
jgi:hypothetical protein